MDEEIICEEVPAGKETSGATIISGDFENANLKHQQVLFKDEMQSPENIVHDFICLRFWKH